MTKVKFTEMKHGSKEDYLLLEKHEKKYIEGTADRLIKFINGLSSTLEGYQITRLEHSLQTATRALNDKADDEMVAAALLRSPAGKPSPARRSAGLSRRVRPRPRRRHLGHVLEAHRLRPATGTRPRPRTYRPPTCR